MVFMNKETNDAYVDCYCGCDSGLRIKIDTEDTDEFGLYCVLTYTSGNFYKQQENCLNRLMLKCKKIWYIIRNKDFHYSEICMTKDDFEKFKKIINDV